MRKIFKYSILIVFAVMLHSVIMKASDILSATPYRSECYLSQGQTNRQAIERFYHYYAELSCETIYSDICYSSICKYKTHLLGSFREHQSTSPQPYYTSPQSLFYDFSTPATYYIFGLRKIIV
ncbi:hypothetical protein [uncultured Bacteroides sp.]|uniref:hypothetical protein n=1 Tax=uncultured Bacteroides sp. TaxID=162156 RepID=UPI002AA6F479|nr:hypothetical protein [uncultured Bacteroides sp.]